MSTRVDLPVSGMTCAACARAIERKLSKTPGVGRANVNLATNTATVEYDEPAQLTNLIDAIEDLGYGVPETEPARDAAETSYRTRLIVAIACAAPIMALGMTERAPWIQLLLALPVIFYAGAPFYRDAFTAARHLSANMNTLIALGTGVAYAYSVVAALFPGIFPLSFRDADGGVPVYFEAAAVITALVLLGQVLELRAR